MSKKDYCRLSGVQRKVIDEQAIRYGLPIDGSEIDLAELLTKFHRLLAKNYKGFDPFRR
jgi:hypothetical protein